MATDVSAVTRSRVASWREDSRKDPEELEREIDETRADVEATLEALERRLRPERLIDQTLGRVRSHGGELAGNLGHAVKQNPVPMLLTSIGIAWMMMLNRRDGEIAMREGDGGMRERLHGARERWSGAKESARQRTDAARERLEHAREGISHAAQSMRSGAGRTASRARHEAARMRSGFDHLLEEQPLLLGAIGLAAGALVGAALPPSEMEDRWLGETRDRALDRAKRAGDEGFREARRHAQGLAEKAESALEKRLGGESREQGAAPAGRAEGGRDYGEPEDYGRAAERGAEPAAREPSSASATPPEGTPPL